MVSIFKKSLFLGRMITSNFRMDPSFIIIGGRGCGTTSLFNYLIEHPCILSPLQKEIHFFHHKFFKGLSWYKGFFPKKGSTILFNDEKILPITGEASADYIHHPLAPKRISEVLPNVKLIVLLRNPVDRAYSDYQKAVSGGSEDLTFEESLEYEDQRINGEIEKIMSDENYYSFNFWHHAYLYQSRYAHQLKNWFSYFDRNKILIIKSEDMFSNPAKVVQQVFSFLDLPNFPKISYKKYNVGNYSDLSHATRQKLLEYFKPYNEELSKLTDQDFSWNK